VVEASVLLDMRILRREESERRAKNGAERRGGRDLAGTCVSKDDWAVTLNPE
jgi:hypothetical protein